MKFKITFLLIFCSLLSYGQDSTNTYKKRVLETSEVSIISSYYSQDGENAAVTGGIGTEKLTDFASSFIVAIPLNDDDILSIDAGVSAYTSASSSNVGPFDGSGQPDPYVASSGASGSDLWVNGTFSYSHSSDSRNDILGAKVSVSSEYDYFSLGFGGSYYKLFNEKNTELGISANVYLDNWSLIYPEELRGDPTFKELDKTNRNSYSLGLTFSQILTKTIQGALSLDVIQQQGLLSTPFQRIYFADIEDSPLVGNFQLADDIERLPDSRFKTALGGRLNIYLNETFVLRTYYRYYFDDWGINSHTASLEIPIKITDQFTLYPSYRYYNQTKADYFYPYNQALSTLDYYTSDYDLSKYAANEYGFGINYTDIFTKLRLARFGLKSVDLKYNYYKRDSGLHYSLISAGLKFIQD